MSHHTNIRLMLACNDPATGRHRDTVDEVVFQDAEEELLLSLELSRGKPPTCYPTNDASTITTCQPALLRLGRRVYPIERYKSWVGNWCWDCAYMTPDVAAQIANYLRRMGKFDVRQGVTLLWNKWNGRQPFRAGDFEESEEERPCTTERSTVR